jgi:serine/threonine-protein kinase
VNVVVSLGAQAAVITIPDVRTMNLVTATSELEAKPYLMDVHPELLNTVPPGDLNSSPNTVLSQTPAAHTTAHAGASIILYVLSPNAQFAVPKLNGDTTNQASQVLGQSNLTVGTTTTACSNTVGIGLVIRSTPAVGTLVNSGDQISLTTASGYCKVQVPSVLGDNQVQATATLKLAHLQVNVTPTDPSICSPSEVNSVTDQSLAPSTYVPFNSTITISVCDASTETTTTTPTTTTT